MFDKVTSWNKNAVHTKKTANTDVTVHILLPLVKCEYTGLLRLFIVFSPSYCHHLASDKNRLWRPCVLTDRDEMSNRYREPSINASYQVSVHLDKRFQRRIFLEIDQSEARID
jgi:hypothetical protein